MDRLFVYGTLMVGRQAHGLLEPWVRGARPGRRRGSLYLMPAGYPAMLEDDRGEVHGEVLDLDPAMPWPPLDAYEGFTPDDPEGSLYLRCRRAVTVEADRTIDAWCYVMRVEAEADLLREGAQRLEGGRWPPRNPPPSGP